MLFVWACVVAPALAAVVDWNWLGLLLGGWAVAVVGDLSLHTSVDAVVVHPGSHITLRTQSPFFGWRADSAHRVADVADVVILDVVQRVRCTSVTVFIDPNPIPLPQLHIKYMLYLQLVSGQVVPLFEVRIH